MIASIHLSVLIMRSHDASGKSGRSKEYTIHSHSELLHFRCIWKNTWMEFCVRNHLAYQTFCFSRLRSVKHSEWLRVLHGRQVMMSKDALNVWGTCIAAVVSNYLLAELLYSIELVAHSNDWLLSKFQWTMESCDEHELNMPTIFSLVSLEIHMQFIVNITKKPAMAYRILFLFFLFPGIMDLFLYRIRKERHALALFFSLSLA